MKLIPRWRWLVRQITRELWLTAVVYSCAAVVSVLAGIFIGPFIPTGIADYLGPEAVGRVLGILASSMLAVTTFSLATMVSAHGTVTASTSPRASPLIINDGVTRNALGTFIGSFLFSLVGLVALNAELYGKRGHVVLFFVTILVIAIIIVALLRWIDHLTRLTRISETTDRVEEVALEALLRSAKTPCMGARRLDGSEEELPDNARPVYAESIGYVQHIDMQSLFSCVRSIEDRQAGIYVLTPPGGFVEPSRPLAKVTGISEDETLGTIRDAFSIGSTRTFDFDPRFGLTVLGEIASRALSPAINDPGTAIDVIGRAVRLLSTWATTEPAPPEEEDEEPPAVWVRELSVDDLFDDIFTPIARDGASLVSVQIRLQKALHALAGLDGRPMKTAARRHARLALERAEAAMAIDADKDRLRELVENRETPPG